jgi:hypothetical protein
MGCCGSIGRSFKFHLKVGVEESIVNAPRISRLNLISVFTLFVFLLCRLTSGAFTIDYSTPTLRRNLNEHPVPAHNAPRDIFLHFYILLYFFFIFLSLYFCHFVLISFVISYINFVFNLPNSFNFSL